MYTDGCHANAMNSRSLLSLCLYSALLATGQAMFKLAAKPGASNSNDQLSYAIHLFTTPIFLAACLLYALSTVLWVALLARYPLSQAYPFVIAVSIVLTTAIGLTLFKEQMTMDKIIGLALVCVGVKILSRGM
jgi:multidrug transporter EmrE-like cation transporter